MFLKLGPASLSLSSVKFGKGGYAVFRNEHFHFGVAVQELPIWFCTLFRFRGHCHFLVKQTLGIHFRRNPLSRNSWRKRDPVSKEKDDTYPISRNGSEARRSRFFCSRRGSLLRCRRTANAGASTTRTSWRGSSTTKRR